MNIEKISSIYSQLQALEKNGLRDTDKYRQLFDELKAHRESATPMQEEIEKQEMTPENLQNVMSESQVYQVQQQILGYKMLIRNMNVPKDVEKNMFTLSKEQWEIEKEKLVQRSLKYYNEGVEKNEELKKLLSRYNSSKKTPAVQAPQSQGDGNASQNMEFLNDPATEQYIEKNTFFIEKRKKEIKELIGSGYLTEDAKARLQTELKFLEILPFYNKLKNNMFKLFVKNKPNRVFEKVLLDRKFFSRERPTRKYESKMMEKIENQIKSEQEQRKKIRHKEFLASLYQHQAEFFEYHKRKGKFLKKRGIAYKAHLEQLEKNKQEAKDKETKKRVQALKDKDFESYVKMVQEAKNTKILELLQHTDDFLRQIGAKVKLQKGDNPDENQDEELDQKNVEDSSLNLKNSDRIYYNITHSKKEEVKEQPSILEGGTLKNYQMIGLQWMVSLYNNKLNGILADEMGLGKTIQTISLFCYIIEVKKNFGPFLIVVPLTTLSNWVLEFEKWAPSITKIVYKGPPQSRKNLAHTLKNSKWNVCLTTYEYILKDRLVLNKFHWQYIIIDEGHRMKNSRSKFASTLGQQYVSEHRLLLTGTPLQNNLAELWSLLNFLLPKVFNSSDEFEKWFSLAVVSSNEKEAQLTEEEQLLIINRLHQVLRPFLLRRVKKEVESEIPNKVEHVIKVELSYWQKIVYDQIKDNGSLSKDPNGKFQTKALMNLMMQLRKICNHPYLFLDDEYYLNNVNDEIFRSSGKFELLDRILPKLISAKHRILIFSQMTNLMNVMQLYFDYRGFKHLRLDGATKADERGERVMLFNKENSEYDIFLLSTRAGGLGLNLQTADTVILFDSDWNPQMDLQAQDRAHRIGAKSEVRVYRLVTNTVIEEEILSKAAFKQSLDEVLIQAGMYNEKSTESERRERLEDLLKKKATDSDSEDEIPDDEQLNEILARNEDEFKYYEQFDRNRYEREKLLYKNFKDPTKSDRFYNYRLLPPEETPSWVRVDSKVDDSKKEYGRGNRVRKQVNYIDDVEEQAKADDAEEFQEGSTTGQTRTRRTRSQKNMDNDRESSTDGRRVLRKRNTLRKNIDPIITDEEEDDGLEDDDEDEEEPEAEDSDDEEVYRGGEDEDGVPKKKFRRIKKMKKNDDEEEGGEKQQEDNGIEIKFVEGAEGIIPEENGQNEL